MSKDWSQSTEIQNGTAELAPGIFPTRKNDKERKTHRQNPHNSTRLPLAVGVAEMWKDTASGVAGATACAVLGLPFDVAKSRLQAGSGSYSGLGDCILRTARSEGPLALYKGLMPALGSAVIENAVGITTQRSLRRQLAWTLGRDADTRFSMPTEMALGGATGVFTSIAICPMEVLKVRLQVQVPTPSWFAEASRVLRGDGVLGLYTGFGALALRDVPFNALFYGCYETICSTMMRLRDLRSKDDLGTPSVFFAGGLAGCIGWSVILPFDVVKTRLQAGAAEAGTAALMLEIVRMEGAGALFTGWSAAVARAFPANAGLFAGVELMTRLLKDL